MEGDHIKIWHWLRPFSWLYGLGVCIRNILFDSGVLKSERFKIPVICIGNITAGGTGKTPHTEYLVRLLSKNLHVAVLSRGYKRKSKGLVLAQQDTPMEQIGDEPFQMKQKYPNITLAVDKNRRRAIHRLCESDIKPPVDVVLLDDAFQHRYVTPGLSILLMDYHRLIYFDELLPSGRLREPRSSSRRADIVIVTKCPTYITPMEQHGIERSLEIGPWQRLFFTRFKYGNLRNLQSKREIGLDELTDGMYNVILFTGIASPQQMEYDLKKYCSFRSIHFADHHTFTQKDIEEIITTVTEAEKNAKPTILVTTEKDAARLSFLQKGTEQHEWFPERLRKNIYMLPIEVVFLDEQEQEFNKIISDYVRKNSRNG